jgi:hypothetical protein
LINASAPLKPASTTSVPIVGGASATNVRPAKASSAPARTFATSTVGDGASPAFRVTAGTRLSPRRDHIGAMRWDAMRDAMGALLAMVVAR